MRSPRSAGHDGPSPQRRARRARSRGACATRPLERAGRLAGGGPAVPQSGLGREPRHARSRDGQVDRPEGGGGAHVRVAGARRAANSRTTVDSDRRRDQPLRARPVLPLPERAPQPDQLELRAVRAPRHGHRRHRAARERLPRSRWRASATASRARSTPGGSPNLGPGYRFHYLPHRAPTHPFNLDSAEYASETCHFILYHEQAVRAGMPPLPPEHYRLLRAWVEHIVCAYWTHGGYLNWDTGLRLQALACRPHLGARATGTAGDRRLAAVPQRPGARRRGRSTCSTAGLRLYERLSREAGRCKGHRALEPLRRERRLRSAPASARCSRRACRQTRRARSRSGWRSMGAAEPPPLYSFDGDIGRLDDHHPALLDGGAAGQPERLSLRRDGAVPPLRRRPARRVERGRPAVGELRRAGSRPALKGDRHVAAAPGAGAHCARRSHCSRLRVGP